MKDAVERNDDMIDGVRVRAPAVHKDGRGWLSEVFRRDEIAGDILPVMSYVSVTLPGVARGPHAHRDQTDVFGFFGPSTFRVYLWDDRSDSPTRGRKQVFEAGAGNPRIVVIPPGVIHGYRNVGDEDGYVLNFPNRLYAGEGKKDPVDEIRYEDEPDSPFQLEP